MPSDSFQSRILADWILSDGYKRIAVFYINNAWGKGVTHEFIQAFTRLGGELVAKEVCKVGDRDFRTQLTKIRDTNASALFCPTMPQEGGIILRQMKELGISMPVFGADAWSVDELVQGAGNAADGVMYTYPSQFDGPEYQSFLNAFKSKYNEEPDVNAAGAYDAVKVLAMCISNVLKRGEPITGNNLRIQMEKVKGYRGATGITTFDKNGDPIAKEFSKMIIRNGKRMKYEKQ
jgi:branched-chain amino acid transport system substrate-binding protein